jgi:hypothetical protein
LAAAAPHEEQGEQIECAAHHLRGP